MTSELHASSVVGLLDHLDVTNATLVMHDWSGALRWHLLQVCTLGCTVWHCSGVVDCLQCDLRHPGDARLVRCAALPVPVPLCAGI
jgi:pimeloyl-ACP methyl ester carboxylesterase